MVKSIPENTAAYSPKFSRSWYEKQVHHYKKAIVTSTITTLIMGFLATIYGFLGFAPQATSLGTCTAMGGIATAVALRSLRKHTQTGKKQKRIYQHLEKIEAQMADTRLSSMVQTIKKAISTYPLSFAYMRDYQALNDSLLEASREFSQNPLLTKEWKKVIAPLHKLPFHLVDGRVVVLDLKNTQTILKGENPFSEGTTIELLPQKPSNRDIQAIQSLFKQSAIEPPFSKKGRTIKELLNKNEFSVFVMREKQNMVGMVWLKEKPGTWAIRHCVRAAGQPLSRKIEEGLMEHVLKAYPTERLKACALQGDLVSQQMFKKLGFVYSGVRPGLHGFLEDGMVRMVLRERANH
ncbi:hypothetical protein [Parachlamydia sp. AcF125]|uniref:hypothetical protein n=1 Tax=Parachlamydia sp. AcF125 TaxID=2795736 RepID=UPI001BC9557E|nr:hypothetical protein [Parachlamydia sp. AcF125]MBS4167774.1 hypothetical protein [Parachlamydia sp. AcF125]